ncbi:MAG: hypothetical protein VX278_00050 [Myxococcota bacterium]|nr:hypothetical protein [Myxococcota bacterium]
MEKKFLFLCVGFLSLALLCLCNSIGTDFRVYGIHSEEKTEGSRLEDFSSRSLFSLSDGWSDRFAQGIAVIGAESTDDIKGLKYFRSQLSLLFLSCFRSDGHRSTEYFYSI